MLDGVTPEQAYARPVAAGHSIWELVLHLIGTYDLVLRRLQGDGTRLTLDEDWPQVPSATDSNWRETIGSLKERNQRLRRAVAGFNSEQLDKPLVAEPPYTAYTQFIGITQHDLYHAGQIAILKKALG